MNYNLVKIAKFALLSGLIYYAYRYWQNKKKEQRLKEGNEIEVREDIVNGVPVTSFYKESIIDKYP
jgi:hypothetical protein